MTKILTAKQMAQMDQFEVRITIYNESLERLERMIEMGFKEGFKMSLTNLDNLLASQNQS